MKGISLVTGGASGLGKATVKALVKNGYKVAFCDIQKQRGYNVAKEMGEHVIFVPGDITSNENVSEVLQAIKDKFGKLDNVINCAATHSAFKVANFTKKTCHNLTDFEHIVKVNTIGTFNVIRLSAKMLSENSPDVDGHRGTIINTACLTVYDGQIGQSCLAASKAAIAGMTLPLAREFAPHGIRVNAIAAGLFDTPLLSYLPSNVLKFLGDCSPFPNRLGYPEEFAHLVINLLENTYVNGEIIRLDGANRMSAI